MGGLTIRDKELRVFCLSQNKVKCSGFPFKTAHFSEYPLILFNFERHPYNPNRNFLYKMLGVEVSIKLFFWNLYLLAI